MVSVVAFGMVTFLYPSLGIVIVIDGLDVKALQLIGLSLAAIRSSLLGFHLVALIEGLGMPVMVMALAGFQVSRSTLALLLTSVYNIMYPT